MEDEAESQVSDTISVSDFAPIPAKQAHMHRKSAVTESRRTSKLNKYQPNTSHRIIQNAQIVQNAEVVHIAKIVKEVVQYERDEPFHENLDYDMVGNKHDDKQESLDLTISHLDGTVVELKSIVSKSSLNQNSSSVSSDNLDSEENQNVEPLIVTVNKSEGNVRIHESTKNKVS